MTSPKIRKILGIGFIFLLAIVVAAASAWFFYDQNEKNLAAQRQTRITLLEKMANEFIENRRWQDASHVLFEIKTLAPDSPIAAIGHRRITAGMAEEQTQFIGYWTGQAIAELEASRLNEAEAAANKVLEKFPTEKEAAQIITRIATARKDQAHAAAIAAARQKLLDGHWQAAITAAQNILATTPGAEDAQQILREATQAQEKHAAAQAKAKQLLQQALLRDTGQFDAQALADLREAASLVPNDPAITAQLEKMASYTRTLRVPNDFATPAEALAVARDRDRIILAEQTWKGPLLVNAAIELIGAGPSKTIIECPADQGCAVTIGPNAKGARISGITFRHEAFVAVGADRFSAALVRGGQATFVDCRFNNASGHGLAVIEGGSANAQRSSFNDNAWNGAAALGKGSSLEIKDSEALNNFEHGIETWNEASATLINNRCEANVRNGIHADNSAASAIIVGNQLVANREFGLVIDRAASGKILQNTARANLLGGIVIRLGAASLSVRENHCASNQGPGLVLEKGLSPENYLENILLKNTEPQLLPNADLSRPENGK